MSYIVPGDKPDSCMFCPYNVVDRKHRMTVCKFIPDSYKYDNDLKQYADCPLVEVKTPHGRLIDADFEEQHYTSMTTNPTPDVTEQDKHNSLVIVRALQMAKTIIEAED